MGKIRKKLLPLLLLFVVTFMPNSDLIVETREDYESDDEKQLFI